jgi:hypothetical protein
VERPYRAVLVCAEGEVDVLGPGTLVVDQREAAVAAPELHPTGFLVAEAEARVRRDRRVEAAGRIQV